MTHLIKLRLTTRVVKSVYQLKGYYIEKVSGEGVCPTNTYSGGGWYGKLCDSAGGWSGKFCDSVGGWHRQTPTHYSVW